MLQLNGSVELVALQFSFSNPKIVPDSIRQVAVDCLVDREIRKSQKATDNVILKPTENVYLAHFVDDLKTAGYEIVDALYQPRTDPKDPAGKKIYHMVRFVFASTQSVEKLYEDFMKVRPRIYIDLDGMCVEASWRVRASLNPLLKNDEEVSGKHTLSINLEVRTPLFNPDGHRVLIWEKDENGDRIGDAPVPLMPDYCLRIADGCLKLM